MSAARALVEMAAECGGATAHDGGEHFDVLPAEPRRLRSKKPCPAARIRSATSSGGRLIYCVLW